MPTKEEIIKILGQICDEIMIIPGVTSMDLSQKENGQFYVKIGITRHQAIRPVKEVMEKYSIPREIYEFEFDR